MIGLFRTYVRAVDTLNQKIGSVLKYAIILIFFCMGFEIILRYGLNSPTLWAGEMTQMVFGVYIILSGGYILKHGGHVNVDLFTSRLSSRSKAVLDIFTSCLFFIFSGVMIYFGLSLAWESISMMETSQSAWNPPIWPLKTMVPLGAVLLFLQGVSKLIRDIVLAATGEELSHNDTRQIENL